MSSLMAMPLKGRYVYAAVFAFLLATAGGACAGTIGFRTDAEVTAGPGIDVKVTLTHTGDESADDVNVSAALLDRSVDGMPVGSIRPGQNHTWSFHLFDEIPKGIYAIVLRTRYSDTNGYPFEVVSTAAAAVDAKPAARIFGSVDVPRLTPDGETSATLVLKRPPERSGDFEVRLVAPSGLDVEPGHVPVTFDSTGKSTVQFRVRNRKLLAGTTVNLFALVSGVHAGVPQVDTIRGSVRIGNAAPSLNSPMFYQSAAAVLLLLALLEAIAWASARRSPGT